MDSGSGLTRQRVACVFFPTGTQAPLSRIAEALYRFTPQIAIRDGEAIFLEIGGSAKLFNEATLLLRIQALLKRFECPSARISLAGEAGEALALARHSCRSPRMLPLEALSDCANPFKQDPDLHKKIEKLITTMRGLGVMSFTEFSRTFARELAGSLASRFGREGAELIARVNQHIPIAWPRFRLPERISEQVDLQAVDTLAPCLELEPLFFVLRGIVSRVTARLRGRGLRLSVLELEFALEDMTSRKWKMELPFPQGSEAGLIPILRDRLYPELDRNPLMAPVIRVKLDVLETAPGNGSQRDFFSRAEADAENWEALIGRLWQKMGRDRAFVAAPVDRYLPEKAWEPVAQPVLSPLKTRAAHPVRRPTRLLRKPEELRRLGNFLIHPQHRKRWHAVEWQGPERLSGEWWLDPAFRGFERDYYQVALETGEKFWVFCTINSAKQNIFYLHGFFD